MPHLTGHTTDSLVLPCWSNTFLRSWNSSKPALEREYLRSKYYRIQFQRRRGRNRSIDLDQNESEGLFYTLFYNTTITLNTEAPTRRALSLHCRHTTAKFCSAAPGGVLLAGPAVNTCTVPHIALSCLPLDGLPRSGFVIVHWVVRFEHLRRHAGRESASRIDDSAS